MSKVKYKIVATLALIPSMFASVSAQMIVVHSQSSYELSLNRTTVSTGTCMSPPTNFDLATATDQTLLSYGLPRRPVGSKADVAYWVDVIRHAKHRYFEVGTSENGQSYIEPRTSWASGSTTSFNWAGYVAYATSAFTLVQGKWVVPCYVGSGWSHAEAVTWVGLGGFPSLPLWQGGTTEDKPEGYHFWWELYPNVNIQKLQYPAITCGDQVYVEADWNVNYSGKDYIVLLDMSTGQYTSVTDNVRPGQSTAEWIDERPGCGNGHLYDYQDVNPVYHYGSNATQGSGYYNISGWSNDAVTMVEQYDYYPLAIPTSLGSGGDNFWDDWNYDGNDWTC